MSEPGLYYRSATNEIATAENGDGAVLGSDWLHVDADPTFGLMAARRLLVERGVVAEAAVGDVY